MSASSIAAEIRAGIAAGEYRHGTRLPSVRDLAETHGVSQQTAAAAYTMLATLGLVRTERGSGTTVAAGPAADAHLGTFNPPDLGVAQPWKPATEDAQVSEETTLVRQLAATPEMADWGIPAGTDVVERTRIRSLDGVPVQHKLTVLPYDVASHVPDGHQDVPPMLAPVGAPPLAPPRGVRMADWLGWDVATTDCAITAEPMSPAASEALGVIEGAPGFRILSVTRDSEGSTVYVTATTAPLHHRVTLEITG